MFQPKKSLKSPAKSFFSWNLVTNPKIHDVTGIIAKIMLIKRPIPK